MLIRRCGDEQMDREGSYPGCSLKILGLYPRVTLFNVLRRTLFCSGYIVVWFVLVGLTYV